jgi:hypothetical protein
VRPLLALLGRSLPPPTPRRPSKVEAAVAEADAAAVAYPSSPLAEVAAVGVEAVAASVAEAALPSGRWLRQARTS